MLEKVDTLVVDKTGTLTEGKPTLVAVVPPPGVDEDELLRLAASLEQRSEHPLAAAIVARRARARHRARRRSTDFAVADRARACTGASTGATSRSATPRCCERSASTPAALATRAEALRARRRRP